MRRKGKSHIIFAMVVFFTGVFLQIESGQQGLLEEVKAEPDSTESVLVVEETTPEYNNSIIECIEDVDMSSSNVAEQDTEAEQVNESIFSDISVRLNTQIYDYTDQIYNEMLTNYPEFNQSTTSLTLCFDEYYSPLIPLALSVVEMGAHADTQYTWTPVIFSQDIIKALNDEGIVHGDYELQMYMSDLDVDSVNTDYLRWLCLDKFLTEGSEYGSFNDKSSLGPLQILRNGENVERVQKLLGCNLDLITWEDSMKYFLCMQKQAFMSETSWLVNYHVRNKYEFIAMMAVNHNSGITYMVNRGQDGTAENWGTSKDVMDFIYYITTDDAIRGFQSMVDVWFDNGVECRLQRGVEFPLCGQSSYNDIQRVLDEFGVNVHLESYSGAELEKRLYPIRAILNYMSLVKLYESIGIVEE